VVVVVVREGWWEQWRILVGHGNESASCVNGGWLCLLASQEGLCCVELVK
jgi:hypothetical protein